MKDLGTLHYVLGLQALPLCDGFFISQSKYLIDILTCFNMIYCKSCATPFQFGVKLTKLVKHSQSMLLSIDNWSTILFILLIVNSKFPLLLVWFLGLCRTLNKATRKKSNKFSSISRVPLILVSSIVEVQIHWSISPTSIRLMPMMIKIPLLAMCFTLSLDRWCGRERNRRYYLC
jgi:hypothetical protein